jgi:hypothetical protein
MKSKTCARAGRATEATSRQTAMGRIMADPSAPLDRERILDLQESTIDPDRLAQFRNLSGFNIWWKSGRSPDCSRAARPLR